MDSIDQELEVNLGINGKNSKMSKKHFRLFVEIGQYLKEISSFEAVGGRS